MMPELPSRLDLLYKSLIDALRPAVGEVAGLEARRILAHRTGHSWGDIIARGERIEADARALSQILSDLARRVRGEPLSRIWGMREFYGLEFQLSAETLDPRPDTEILVERALKIFAANPPARILDLGTGSGCIVVTLLRTWKDARGIAVDISEGALRTARANAETHGVADRLGFVCGDWVSPLAGRFDLVVANPPYIESGVIANLESAVKNHDPILALDGGEDGLQAYKKIFSGLKNIFSPQGIALFEIGFDQAEKIARLAGDSGLCVKAVHRDLSGHSRVAEISRGDK